MAAREIEMFTEPNKVGLWDITGRFRTVYEKTSRGLSVTRFGKERPTQEEETKMRRMACSIIDRRTKEQRGSR